MTPDYGLNPHICRWTPEPPLPGPYVCLKCGVVRLRAIVRTCPTSVDTDASPPTELHSIIPKEGPGAELSRLLASLGINSLPGCGCEHRIIQMNIWGVLGCREPEHYAEIIQWLREASANLPISLHTLAAIKSLATSLPFRVNWLDPIPGIIDEAVRRAEIEENRTLSGYT